MKEKNIFIRLSNFFLDKEIVKRANRKTAIVLSIIFWIVFLFMVLSSIYYLIVIIQKHFNP
jgi:hypothetical protein